MAEHIRATVDNDEHSGLRADAYISRVLGVCSRSQLEQFDVTVEINGQPAKLSKKISPGDVIEVHYSEPPPPDVVPEKMDLDIIFENERVVVINKPQGMTVHPAKGHHSGTLVNGMMYHIQTLRELFSTDNPRPGIVHRLDKDTSGVIIAAKDTETVDFLSRQFRKRKVEKEYIALVKGWPPKSSDRIETLIARDPQHRKRFMVSRSGGKTAVTGYRVLRHFNGYALLRLSIETGRTHQIRVHMAHIGCPVLGDPVYARKDNTFPDASLMLHALKLSISLEKDAPPSSFLAPLPKRFAEAVRFMKGSP